MQIFTDNGEKGFVFVTHTDLPRQFCMSPAPDAVHTTSNGVALQVPIPTGTEDLSTERSSGAKSLGGRTESVLLAREFLYRACEFSVNHNLTKEEAKSLYLKSLDIISMTVNALPHED